MRHEVRSALPVPELRSGTYLLRGPPETGKLDLLASLLTEGSEETGMFVSTEQGASGLRRLALQDLVPPEGDVSLVDCTGDDVAAETDRIEAVSTPGDLTDIGLHVSSHLSRSSATPTRFGLHSLSTVLLHAEFRPAFRFLNVLGDGLGSVGGLGALVVSEPLHDERVMESVRMLTDGVIELRVHDGVEEVRVTTPHQQSDWSRRR